MRGGKTAALVAEMDARLAGLPAGDGKTVITIGYMGDRARNRGLEQAIEMLRLKYPGAEIVEVKIEPGAKLAGARPLDAFHTGTL